MRGLDERGGGRSGAGGPRGLAESVAISAVRSLKMPCLSRGASACSPLTSPSAPSSRIEPASSLPRKRSICLRTCVRGGEGGGVEGMRRGLEGEGAGHLHSCMPLRRVREGVWRRTHRPNAFIYARAEGDGGSEEGIRMG